MFKAIGKALKTYDLSVSDEELGMSVVKLVKAEEQNFNARVNKKEQEIIDNEWHTVISEGTVATPGHMNQEAMLLYKIVAQTITRNFNSAVKSEQVQEVA